MKPSKPPALATWLLEHTRFNTDGAVAGDLIEEFNKGRSAAWYWRQVLVAILVGWARDVRRHRVLAIRAVVITWAVNYAVILLSREVMLELSRRGLLGVAFPYGLAYGLFTLVIYPPLGGAVSALLVALLHRRHRNAMLLTSAGALLVWAFVAIIFLKKGALQHSFLEIAGFAIIYYLIALTGFVIGGMPFHSRSENRRATDRTLVS